VIPINIRPMTTPLGPQSGSVVTSVGRRFADLVRAQHDAGHSHCNHTEDHPRLAPRAREEVAAQVSRAEDFLTSIDGVRPELFRAPYGVLSPEVLEIAASVQLRVLDWTIDAADYLKSPPDVLVNRVMSKLRPGAIVLLHDGGGDRTNTVAACAP
jgi:peptidoglycan/xylan/chitin deacetylase (PgdA/CDA1 family)